MTVKRQSHHTRGVDAMKKSRPLEQGRHQKRWFEREEELKFKSAHQALQRLAEYVYHRSGQRRGEWPE